MFYVYVHKLKHSGEVFYVGKGTKARSICKFGRNRFWKNITSKYEWYVEIVEKDLQEWYALELEQSLIYYYGLRINEDGSLVNMLYNDKCRAGGKRTDATKKKMSDASKGREFNKTVYTLKNVNTGEIASGTIGFFLKEKNIKISPIVNKRAGILGGWMLAEEPLPFKILRPDPRVYKFRNKNTQEIFVGTRLEFTKTTGIKVGKLFSAKCINKQLCGWIVEETVKDLIFGEHLGS